MFSWFGRFIKSEEVRVATRKAPNYFVRKYKFPWYDVLLFLIFRCRKCIGSELSQYYSQLGLSQLRISRQAAFKAIKKVDPSVFKSERKAIPEIDSIIGSIKNLAHKTGDFTEITLQANSLADQLKNYATRLYNNKTWMRIFAPMAIALVAVTLVVQPFFGNIKNEFPEEKKSGGNK